MPSLYLLWAAYVGHLGIVQWLLENGASVEEKDNKGATPLLYAAKEGHFETVQWLLASIC
jgi:ankyrin repeat protein